MEVTIQGDASLHVEGDVTVELPGWMTALSPEEQREVHTAPQRSAMVIACGRHPSTGDVVFITGDGSLMELHADEHPLPKGWVRPTDHGHTVAVGDGFEAASDWMIDNAQSILFLGALSEGQEETRVTYLDG